MNLTKAELPGFVAAMDSELLRLRAFAASAAGAPVLDLTEASLPALEALLFQVRERTLITPPGLETLLIRYLGETLRKAAGGEWAVDSERIGKEEVGISGLPGLPKRAFFDPSLTLSDFLRLRKPGLMGRAIASYDVVHGQERFAAWLAATDAELNALEASARVLGRADVLPLDFSEESADRAGALLIALEEKGDAQARDRVARYLGEIMRRHAGAEWSLEINPKNSNFGSYVVARWVPRQRVDMAATQNLPNTLRPDLMRWLAPLLVSEEGPPSPRLPSASPDDEGEGERGLEFVFFKRRPDITLDAAQPRLAAILGVKVRKRGGGWRAWALVVEDADAGAALTVDLNEADYVREENAEITSGHEEDPRWKSADGADARFELSWPLDEVDLINTIASARGVLERWTGGVGFDNTSDEFLDPYP